MDTYQASAKYEIDTGHTTGWLKSSSFRAILCGSLAGFATAVIMAGVGSALGMTSGAVLADKAASLEEAGKGVALGAALWLMISAIVVGFVAGTVMKSLASHDASYRPCLFAFVNWAAGIALAALLATAALGLAGGGAGAAGAAVSQTQPAQDVKGLNQPADTEQVAKAGAATAWALVIAQLLGLGATMLGARVRRGEVHQRITKRQAGGPVLAET